MGFLRFRKANNRAVLGFLLPCIAMGVASVTVLWGRSRGLPLSISTWLPILTLVPAILAGGLLLSIASIPFIPDLGDKDYAYAGLTLNIFLLLLYGSGVAYYVMHHLPG